MVKKDVAQLFRAAQQDQNLRQELSASPTVEAFIKRANEYGFRFTLKEWQEMTGFAVEEMEGELSEIPGI